jgi:hypothetical protein
MELNDTAKAVWRHYYKGAKKVLRSTKGKLGGDLEGYMPSDRNRSKFGLVWRGTHKGEVETIAEKGSFKSKWTNPNFPNRPRTYVAGSATKPEAYAITSAAHLGGQSDSTGFPSSVGGLLEREKSLPNARIYGIAPHVERRADRKVRGYVGDSAATAPIRGGIKRNEVRALLKPTAVQEVKNKWGEVRDRRVLWQPTPLGDIQKKNFARLTRGLKGMKQFQSYHKTPSEERGDFIKAGILSAGVAGGLGIAGLALRNSVGKIERAEIARNAVNRVVAAQRNSKAASAVNPAVQTEAQDASIAAQKIREKRVGSLKKQDKGFTKMVKQAKKNPNLSPLEKEAYAKGHAKWREKNSRYTAFETATVIRQKRDTLSKVRDAAQLAGGLGVLGAAGYAGYRAHGLYKLGKANIPKIADTIKDHVPAVTAKANDLMHTAKSAAAQLQSAAHTAQENVTNSTAVYSDIGKAYKAAKGGLYNILNPRNTLREIKAAYQAGRNGQKTYPTAPRPKWALSAKLMLREFAEKKKSHNIARAAAIGGGALAGGILGSRTLPRLISRGRPMREGESLLGKVVYSYQGKTTPAEIYHLPDGKNLRGILHRAGKRGDLTGKMARGAMKVDDFLGIPQRHYAVGVGSGRVAEVSKTHGRRIIPEEKLGKIMVDTEGTILKDPQGPRPHVEGGLHTNAKEIEGMNSRYEAAQSDSRFKRGSINPATCNNCESYARGIAGQGFRSRQVSAIYGGAAGGALLGGGAVAALTRKKKEFDFEVTEGGVPFTGKIARDRFIKRIHEDDLNRRDSNMAKAALASGAAGALTGSTSKSRLIRAALAAGAGATGVAGIRQITQRDIYGERSRTGKRAELLPAVGAVGAAGAILAKKAKLFSWELLRAAEERMRQKRRYPFPTMKKQPTPAPNWDEGLAVIRAVRKATGMDGPPKHPKFFEDKKSLNPYLGAAISGGLSGGSLGALSILRKGTSLRSAAASAGKLGAVSAGIVGGGALIGSKIIGNPRAEESTPFTKRAAIGGAITGSAAGLAGGLLLRKTRGGARLLVDASKTWRPAVAIRKAPIAGAVGIGTIGGALYGGGMGADEGQQVDTVINLRKDMKKSKEFGYQNQPRRAGTATYMPDGTTRWTRDRGTFAQPVRAKFGLEGPMMRISSTTGKPTTPGDPDGIVPAFTQAQMVRGFYNKGKEINKWGGRGAGLLGDAGSVMAGQERARDASGRVKKREWEKSWFRNAVGSAAAAAGLAGAAYVTTKTPFGQKHMLPRLRSAVKWGESKGVSLLAAKLNKIKQFDDWAAYHGWDVRDPRGRSARVFAPGSRARSRREKEWHEKKENRETLYKAAVVGAIGLGAAAGYAGTRMAGGLPVIPTAVKGIFKAKPISVEAAEEQLKAAKVRANASNITPFPGR